MDQVAYFKYLDSFNVQIDPEPPKNVGKNEVSFMIKQPEIDESEQKIMK